MVFSNHASNQDNNLKDNSSHQNNKAHKEEMSLRWTSTTIFRFDDKTNPAEAGLVLCQSCKDAGSGRGPVLSASVYYYYFSIVTRYNRRGVVNFTRIS